MAPEKTAAPKTDSTPGNPPLVAMPAELVSELLTMIRSRASDDPSPVMERLLVALEQQGQASKRLGEEFARTVRRSNAVAPNLSVFTYDKRCEYCTKKKPHPVYDGDGNLVAGAEGDLAHPKPRLKHQVFICGGKQLEDSLTPLEIELLNSFDKSLSAKGGRWTAMVRRDGNRSILTIDFPARTIDELQDLPRSLPELLSELLYGEEATDAMDLVAEVVRLKKRLAELESQTNTTASGAAGSSGPLTPDVSVAAGATA